MIAIEVIAEENGVVNIRSADAPSVSWFRKHEAEGIMGEALHDALDVFFMNDDGMRSVAAKLNAALREAYPGEQFTFELKRRKWRVVRYCLEHTEAPAPFCDDCESKVDFWQESYLDDIQ